MEWGGGGRKQGGAVGCWEGKAEATAELENGDRPCQGVPEGTSPALPWGTQRCHPTEMLPSEPSIPFRVRTDITSTREVQWGSFHSPSHISPVSRDVRGGMPKEKASHSLGYPPAPGREVPPASRLGPGSGRAVGTVSISRGALLEKEQKPREAINSHLLHTSASSAPASRGRGVPQPGPGSAPPSNPLHVLEPTSPSENQRE